VRNSHTNPNECSYDYIRDFLINSNYIGNDFKDFSCQCYKRTPVYISEWDSEYREYFDKFTGGIRGATQIIDSILNLKDTSDLPEPLKEKIEEIPQSHRTKLAEVARTLGNIKMPPFVDRIALTINGDYKGYVDIAPTGGISEVIIKPPLWMHPPKYYLTCERNYNPVTHLLRPDKSEEIKCVPYVKVQEQIGVCAQYAVRLALMIMSPEAPTVPELNFGASRTSLSGGIERLENEGWNAEEITHIIENEGYGTTRFSRHFCEECQKPLRKVKCSECEKELLLSPVALEPTIENIYAYIESGIPVLIGVKDVSSLPWWKDVSENEAHALVAIGHTISKEGHVDGLIVHDESTYPYQVLPESLGGEEPFNKAIMEAIVPLHREITIDYPTARELALEFADLEDGQEYRPLLVEADHINRWLGTGLKREHFHEYSLDEKVLKSFSNAFLDRYVWLFEIKRELGNNKRRYEGDVIISATRPEVLGFNFPLQKVLGFRNETMETKSVDY